MINSNKVIKQLHKSVKYVSFMNVSSAMDLSKYLKP